MSSTSHCVNTKCYQIPHSLGPDGNQVGKRGRERQGEEKGECEAGKKGYKGMREIRKGHIGEEKVGCNSKSEVTVAVHCMGQYCVQPSLKF